MFKKKILLPHQYYYPGFEMLGDKVTQNRKKEMLADLPSGNKEVLLYLHFPFCDSHCVFCGFDKRYNLEDIVRYVERLKEELAFYSQYGYRIQNIHLGGGTPTLVPGRVLQEIIAFVKENYDCAPDMDINIEGSATSIYRDDIIQFIKESGVTRTSVGIQTFDRRMREIFQTQATLEQVYLTLATLKKNQIRVFTDILFGYPDFGIGETPQEIIARDIREVVSLRVEGIDFSQIYPYGNRLSGMIKEKNLRFPSTAELTAYMSSCMEYMEAHGYHQETSYGFVKQGRIIMETSYYGGMKPVTDTLAVGCSAFGMLNGYKYRNSMYSGYMRHEVPAYMEIKKLSRSQLEQMDIVGFPKLLKLSKNVLEKSSRKSDFDTKLRRLVQEGMIEEREDCYCVTAKGRLFVDNIYYFMLDDEERSVINREMKIVEFA